MVSDIPAGDRKTASFFYSVQQHLALFLVQDQQEQGAKTTEKRLTNLAKNVQNIQPVQWGLVALLRSTANYLRNC